MRIGFLTDASVARLDWAAHRAAHSAQAEPLDSARLAGVAPSEMPHLTFTMESSLSLLSSPWPVDRIWRAHQGGGEPTERLDLDAGGVCLEIRSAGESVTLRALDPPTYAFRDALARGLTLGEAAGLALESHPTFDLVQAIRELLDESLLSELHITSRDKG